VEVARECAEGCLTESCETGSRSGSSPHQTYSSWLRLWGLGLARHHPPRHNWDLTHSSCPSAKQHWPWAYLWGPQSSRPVLASLTISLSLSRYSSPPWAQLTPLGSPSPSVSRSKALTVWGRPCIPTHPKCLYSLWLAEGLLLAPYDAGKPWLFLLEGASANRPGRPESSALGGLGFRGGFLVHLGAFLMLFRPDLNVLLLSKLTLIGFALLDFLIEDQVIRVKVHAIGWE
jgi:hypothetical protein